jgi:phosphatidylglycerophosphatase C
VLALFDLDGTLSRHDTLRSYVGGYLRRHPGRLLRLPLALPALVRYALGRADRGELKSAFLRAAFAGRTRAEIDAWTARFVPRLIQQGLLADALAALAAHRDRGDYPVLLSASPDLYVPALASALGFAETISTGFAWRGDRFDGTLTTANRRGPEKARCMAELRAKHPGLPIVAYANAESDLQHLALADQALLVNGTRRARQSASRSGIGCITWR